jgi:hypothetical protein
MNTIARVLCKTFSTSLLLFDAIPKGWVSKISQHKYVVFADFCYSIGRRKKIPTVYADERNGVGVVFRFSVFLCQR